MGKEYCCKEMRKANEPCTDNEGYGALIWRGDRTMGLGLADIQFCPWCGKDLDAEEEDE